MKQILACRLLVVFCLIPLPAFSCCHHLSQSNAVFALWLVLTERVLRVSKLHKVIVLFINVGRVARGCIVRDCKCFLKSFLSN